MPGRCGTLHLAMNDTTNSSNSDYVDVEFVGSGDSAVITAGRFDAGNLLSGRAIVGDDLEGIAEGLRWKVFREQDFSLAEAIRVEQRRHWAKQGISWGSAFEKISRRIKDERMMDDWEAPEKVPMLPVDVNNMAKMSMAVKCARRSAQK